VTIGGGDHLSADAHGLISDTASTALVAADGTIDWWCPGRVDATPLLTRLLEPTGACLRVGPWAPSRPPLGTQTYRDGSMVLVTLLTGPDSLVEVVDLIPWDGNRPTNDAADRMAGRLIRRVRVLRGPADVSVEVVPSGDPRDISVWSDGMAFAGCVVHCGHPMQLAYVPPPAPARPSRRLVAAARVRLETGEGLVVTVARPGQVGDALSFDAADRLIERTVTAWQRVADAVEIDGRYADAARRSLLVVRALSSHGAPVAAPTTSLPRVTGGERNADGRVVSPVTAASWATLAAGAGLAEEAEAAAGWLAAALDHDPPLPAALAVDAQGPATESHLSALSGWRGSQPVVVGTNTPDRVSVEPAAAVIAAAAALTQRPEGGPLLGRWDRVVVHADWLADHWDEADASVWDLHRGPLAWVSTRLAARHALAAAAESATRRHPLDLDAAGWHATTRDIERWLTTNAVGPGGVLRPVGVRGATVTAGVGDSSDAALARVAGWGPWPPYDQVVNATLDVIIQRNGHGPWIYPWPTELDDGLAGAEPASVTATLWVARALAGAGRWEEAHERMEAAISLAGPLHLLPESVDATTTVGLGNRPAAAAHVALAAAAQSLGVSAPS